MTPVRVLVVDDEAPARLELERILRGIPGVELAGSLGVAAQVLPAVERAPCDLVLLDIHMPGQNGLVVAAALLDLPAPPHVAFVTAHDEHALAAFEREALDYVLKPAAPDRIARLVERVRAHAASPPPPESLARLSGPREPPLLLGASPGSARRTLVRLPDLLYVEAADELVFLVTAVAARPRLLAQQSLAELESSLAPWRFVRTHRSFLVNLDRVLEVEPDREGTCTLRLDSGDARIPVSRRHWPDLKRRLEGKPV